jgi:hypothetical protein
MEAGDGLAEAIAELIATVREAEEDFNRRKEVIMGELVRK